MATQVAATQVAATEPTWSVAGAADRAKIIRRKAARAEKLQNEKVSSETSAQKDPLAERKSRQTEYLKKVQLTRSEINAFKDQKVVTEIDNLLTILVGEDDSDQVGPVLAELDNMMNLTIKDKKTFLNRKVTPPRLEYRNEVTISVLRFLKYHGVNLNRVVLKKGNNNMTVRDIVLSAPFEKKLVSSFGKNYHTIRKQYGGDDCEWTKYYVRKHHGNEVFEKDVCIELYFKTDGVPEQPKKKSDVPALSEFPALDTKDENAEKKDDKKTEQVEKKKNGKSPKLSSSTAFSIASTSSRDWADMSENDDDDGDNDDEVDKVEDVDDDGEN